jgi:hypothetical protein
LVLITEFPINLEKAWNLKIFFKGLEKPGILFKIIKNLEKSFNYKIYYFSLNEKIYILDYPIPPHISTQ